MMIQAIRNVVYAPVKLHFYFCAMFLLLCVHTWAMADMSVESIEREKKLNHLLEEPEEVIVVPEKPVVSPGVNERRAHDIDDPCLPALYKDWSEFSIDMEDYRRSNKIVGASISIDPANYQIRLEAILSNGKKKEIIRQNVGVGGPTSPTPEGFFIINHIYCYPDVLFFPENSEPIKGLYSGFFAPLHLCDQGRNCRRHNDLGLHGFHVAHHPNSDSINHQTFGAVSAGCVRVSDPCSFKMELIRLVGIGSLRQNDRGYYHWLKKPVQVVVQGEEIHDADQTTIASILEESISSFGLEFSNIIKWLYR